MITPSPEDSRQAPHDELKPQPDHQSDLPSPNRSKKKCSKRNRSKNRIDFEIDDNLKMMLHQTSTN